MLLITQYIAILPNRDIRDIRIRTRYLTGRAQLIESDFLYIIHGFVDNFIKLVYKCVFKTLDCKKSVFQWLFPVRDLANDKMPVGQKSKTAQVCE